MTGEEWALAASAFFSGLAAGLLGMLSTIMRPMLAAMDGRDFRGFMEAFLQFAAHSWGKVFNYAWAAGMTLGPAAALVLLADDPGSTSFILTAIALAIVIGGVLVVSNVWKTPTYNLILGWDPEALPADWEAGRQRYFLINWIQLAVTWVVFALLLVALVSLLGDSPLRMESDYLSRCTRWGPGAKDALPPPPRLAWISGPSERGEVASSKGRREELGMSIRMDQPKRFDLVGNRVMIAGIGTGFEATINYRVHEGHDEVTGSITVGGGTGEHAQFQVKANVGNAAFQLDRLFVEVFEISAQDGSELHKVSKPVLLGARMVDGDYIGYREHVVQAGDTLSAIAQEHYGAPDVDPLVRANAHQIDDPDLIFPGQVIRVPIGTG